MMLFDVMPRCSASARRVRAFHDAAIAPAWTEDERATHRASVDAGRATTTRENDGDILSSRTASAAAAKEEA